MLFVKAGLLVAGGASLNLARRLPAQTKPSTPHLRSQRGIPADKVGGAQRVANSIQV